MATEKEMYELLGRAMTDAGFNAALAADPTGVAAGLGITLTDDQLAGLQASDLVGVSDTLDERLSRVFATDAAHLLRSAESRTS